jgi:hypothetical protein
MNIDKLKELLSHSSNKKQFEKQVKRVEASGSSAEQITKAVNNTVKNLQAGTTGSIVIYGDPQSGKTEMMICLTAKLLDLDKKLIIHLLNDSVDLLAQNLDRFRIAGLAPAPRNSSDLATSPLQPNEFAVLFCKKNAKDLRKLISAVETLGPAIIIDDEADFATPNSKVNNNGRTEINKLVHELLDTDGIYIGVTATPARLNLNNTFDNLTEFWVHFPPHSKYTGPDTFFPQDGQTSYRLKLLEGPVAASDAQRALARFAVTVAHLNTTRKEENYSFLVHTSGKTDDHFSDRRVIETSMKSLIVKDGEEYDQMLTLIAEESKELYPDDDVKKIATYITENASRCSFIVLNSKRDRATAGDKPTTPTCPFTVIIGGNIVSRGVTFPNLLSMFFTRDVKTKLQQDTYIQRARMFGARGEYLEDFELTIPKKLYLDWHRCFVFHRLALASLKQNKSRPPVWVGDSRISIAASSSVDRSTVDMDRGEMSFEKFNCDEELINELDHLADSAPTSIRTLEKMATLTNNAIPTFLVKYLRNEISARPDVLAIHKASKAYGSSDEVDEIARKKGYIGNPQLEKRRFPNSLHHIKIFYNDSGIARVFYKNEGSVHFAQNLRESP